MNLKRNRYQNGSLTIEKRKTGPSVWVYRWRAMNAHGEQVRRKVVLGTKAELPTKTAALKQIPALELDINALIEAPISPWCKCVNFGRFGGGAIFRDSCCAPQ